MQQFDTILQMLATLLDEQSAIDHFTSTRWKNGVFCRTENLPASIISQTSAPTSAVIAASGSRSKSAPFSRIVKSRCARGCWQSG
jgi:hypothetical protein